MDTPLLYNVNFGHSVPRCIIPYGAKATVDFDNKTERAIQFRKWVNDRIIQDQVYLSDFDKYINELEKLDVSDKVNNF